MAGLAVAQISDPAPTDRKPTAADSGIRRQADANKVVIPPGRHRQWPQSVGRSRCHNRSLRSCRNSSDAAAARRLLRRLRPLPISRSPEAASEQKQKKENSKKLKQELSSTYKKWLNEDVRWIITPEELTAFKQLSNDEERDAVHRDSSG